MDEMIEFVIKKLSARPDVEQITGPQAAQMVSEFPGIPAEYVDFLTRVGFGDLGELQFYEGPVPAGDIYPQHKNTTTIIIICDDFQGTCYGFDMASDFALVEISPKGAVSPSSYESLSGLITSYFGGQAL
ncbi:MAG: hypothetical protein ABI353_10245 [Isosphaeraceae bacterium]